MTREVMYVSHTIEALSCIYCCRGKAK